MKISYKKGFLSPTVDVEEEIIGKEKNLDCYSIK